MKKDRTVEDALKRFRDAWEFDRKNREEARDDLRNLSGDQWPEEERNKREQQKRPFLTINRLPQQVRQVTGDLRQNRPAVKVRPVDSKGDPEVAKIYSGLIRNIEARSKGERPYITAGIMAASCGMGHFRVLTDYAHAETFEQDIYIEPIHNPFAVVWDPLARSSTRSDARFCFVIERMSNEAFEAEYPDAKRVDFEEGQSETDLTEWFDDDTVRIAEYWVKEPVKKTMALMPDGDVVCLEDIEDEDERAEMEMFAQESRRIDTHRVLMYKISGVEVLEGPIEWQTPDIPIFAVPGEEIVLDEEVRRAGIIRYAKDSQRMYNYWNTANAEFVALQPKQPYIAAIDQIAPFASDWKEANVENRPVLPYKPVPNAPPPQRQQPAMSSPGMINAMMQAAEDIKATTGIYDASLGNRSNEISGVAIRQRQAEGDVSTYFIADNVSAAVQQCGRVLVDLIPRIYDTQRMVRILNEDSSEEFVEINQPNYDQDGPILLNDLSVGRYDVDVSTGPSYATARQEAADSLIQFGQAYPQAAPLIMDLVAKNMDWPGADEIAERLRKALPPGMGESEEDKESPEYQARQQAMQQQAQMEQQRLMLEFEKLKAEVQKSQADAQEAAADTEKTRAETAQQVLETAVQSGQFEQLVRQMVGMELQSIMSQQAGFAPAPGSGV